MRIEAIKIGTNPLVDVNVIIEVPLGGQPIKYELDKNSGTLVVDRFLYQDAEKVIHDVFNDAIRKV